MLAPFLAAWVISPPLPPPRALGVGALELRLPPGWDSNVAHGGLGGDPVGITVLTAASFALPDGAEGCGQPLPQLRRGDAVVSIYDYGDGALAPRFRRATSVRAGRIRYAGRSLSVFVTYGGRRRPASVVRAVRRLLASATIDRA